VTVYGKGMEASPSTIGIALVTALLAVCLLSRAAGALKRPTASNPQGRGEELNKRCLGSTNPVNAVILGVAARENGHADAACLDGALARLRAQCPTVVPDTVISV